MKAEAVKGGTPKAPQKAVTGTLPDMEQVWKFRIPAAFLHMLLQDAHDLPPGGEFSYTSPGGNTVTATQVAMDGEGPGRFWDFHVLEQK